MPRRSSGRSPISCTARAWRQEFSARRCQRGDDPRGDRRQSLRRHPLRACRSAPHVHGEWRQRRFDRHAWVDCERHGGAGEYVFYAAAKGGIDALTIGLAREVAKEGIRFNTIRPGPTKTEIHEPGRLERITPLLPMARPGEPQEIAEAILFLLSDAASYISGAILNVSGAR